MFNIEQYLKKITKGLVSIEINKKSIIDIINKHTNLKLNIEDIEIKDYKILVNTNSIGKSQLFLFKNKILEEIKSSVSDKIFDIK